MYSVSVTVELTSFSPAEHPVVEHRFNLETLKSVLWLLELDRRQRATTGFIELKVIALVCGPGQYFP